MENPIKVDDLVVPMGTPISGNPYVFGFNLYFQTDPGTPSYQQALSMALIVGALGVAEKNIIELQLNGIDEHCIEKQRQPWYVLYVC